jgi:CheY-like chemotaxis protein
MDKSEYTILIVEDDPATRQLYQEEFTDEGFCVLTAENGLKAILKLRSEKVHLLITDVKMPDMNAFEILPQVRLMFPVLPIIVVTAYYKKLKEDFLSKGFDIQALMVKPVDMPELKQKVREILGIQPKGKNKA